MTTTISPVLGEYVSSIIDAMWYSCILRNYSKKEDINTALMSLLSEPASRHLLPC